MPSLTKGYVLDMQGETRKEAKLRRAREKVDNEISTAFKQASQQAKENNVLEAAKVLGEALNKLELPLPNAGLSTRSGMLAHIFNYQVCPPNGTETQRTPYLFGTSALVSE